MKAGTTSSIPHGAMKHGQVGPSFTYDAAAQPGIEQSYPYLATLPLLHVAGADNSFSKVASNEGLTSTPNRFGTVPHNELKTTLIQNNITKNSEDVEAAC